MQIILKQSNGHNIVLRPQSRPRRYQEPTAQAASVELLMHRKDQPASTATLVGVFAPGQKQIPVPFNPVTDKTLIFRTVSISASGVRSVSNLEDAPARDLDFQRASTSVAGIDAHVPTVTLPPSVAATGEGLQLWIVVTPAPDADGATLMHGEVRVEKADNTTVFTDWGVAVAKQHLILQPPYDCKISYRWQNQSEEDAGDGRGWSAWSPQVDAPGSSASVQPASAADVLPTVTFDAHDSLKGIGKEVIAQ